MQINPGGRLDTKDIIGRDNEIDRYWRVLQRHGLVLSAERRIGKTHILFKMREECDDGYPNSTRRWRAPRGSKRCRAALFWADSLQQRPLRRAGR